MKFKDKKERWFLLLSFIDKLKRVTDQWYYTKEEVDNLHSHNKGLYLCDNPDYEINIIFKDVITDTVITDTEGYVFASLNNDDMMNLRFYDYTVIENGECKIYLKKPIEITVGDNKVCLPQYIGLCYINPLKVVMWDIDYDGHYKCTVITEDVSNPNNGSQEEYTLEFTGDEHTFIVPVVNDYDLQDLDEKYYDNYAKYNNLVIIDNQLLEEYSLVHITGKTNDGFTYEEFTGDTSTLNGYTITYNGCHLYKEGKFYYPSDNLFCFNKGYCTTDTQLTEFNVSDWDGSDKLMLCLETHNNLDLTDDTILSTTFKGTGYEVRYISGIALNGDEYHSPFTNNISLGDGDGGLYEIDLTFNMDGCANYYNSRKNIGLGNPHLIVLDINDFLYGHRDCSK